VAKLLTAKSLELWTQNDSETFSIHRHMSWGKIIFFRAIEQLFGQRSENLVHV